MKFLPKLFSLELKLQERYSVHCQYSWDDMRWLKLKSELALTCKIVPKVKDQLTSEVTSKVTIKLWWPFLEDKSKIPSHSCKKSFKKCSPLWMTPQLKKKKKGSPTEAALEREKIYNLMYLKNQCEKNKKTMWI